MLNLLIRNLNDASIKKNGCETFYIILIKTKATMGYVFTNRFEKAFNFAI